MSIRLKEILSEKGITQKELAERLGISTVGMSKIATGDNPSLSSLQKIADAIGVPVWELLVSRDEICATSPSGTAVCPHCGHPLTIKIE